MTVFGVWRGEFEDLELIGVYSSWPRAEAARAAAGDFIRAYTVDEASPGIPVNDRPPSPADD